MADMARPADRLSRRGFLTLTAAGLTASLSTPIALADNGKPVGSAGNGKLIDFTHLQVPVDQVVAAGYTGVIVYVSELRPGATFDFKPVSRGYTDALRAAGLHVVSVYQYGKPGWVNSPSDYTRGFDRGVADGFLKPEHRTMVEIVTRVADVFPAIERWRGPPVSKWLAPPPAP